MNDMPLYFITVMEKLEPSDYGFCNTGDTRCWGFYFDKQDAIDVVHESRTDLRETCYNYAVIEEYRQGISGYEFNRQFFKWDSDKAGYFEIDEPECVKHVCSFAIG